MKAVKRIKAIFARRPLPEYMVGIEGKRLQSFFPWLDGELKYDLQPLPGGFYLRRSYPMENSEYFESSHFCEDLCRRDLRPVYGFGSIYAPSAPRAGRKVNAAELASLVGRGLGYRFSLALDCIFDPLSVMLMPNSQAIEEEDGEDSYTFYERLMKEIQDEETEKDSSDEN